MDFEFSRSLALKQYLLKLDWL